ncbi:S49 family peptidase [Patescibacteria group bacterium]|nr:S49 family peptidase [Patescibacteria group bacterium]
MDQIDYNKTASKGSFWDSKTARIVAILIIMVASLTVIKNEVVSWSESSSIQENGSIGDEDRKTEVDDYGCNVHGIELHGELTTYLVSSGSDDGYGSDDATASQDVVYAIKKAEQDDDVKAILLEVDSYGGYPVAGEEVARAVKESIKPIVGLIREGGASAAYLAVSGADRIIASKSSDVGSISVTMSYLDNVKQNQDQGLKYVSLTSGKFKDTGNPNKPLTDEDQELLMRDVKILHNNFVEMVAENRGMEIKDVEALADGSTMLGEMALENGLIDQIGGMQEVQDYLKDVIGEEVVICW